MKKIKIIQTGIKKSAIKAIGTFVVCLCAYFSNAQGPVLLKDINTSGDTYINNPLTLNGKTLFVADDGIHGYEIWSTDGTTGGTQMIKDINTNPGTSGLGSNLSEVFKGKVYFSGYGGLGNEDDYELWVTNGTASGTKQFKDLNPGNTQSVWGPHEFTVAGSKLFFVGYGGINNEAVLYVSDGTSSGTVSLGVTAYNLFAYGDKLIFSGHDNVNGDEDIFIWENGVISPLVDINPNPGFASEPHDFIIFNGLVYFTEVQITPFLGRELWVTDGTTGGTHIVKDIITNTGSLTGNELSGFTIYNDKLFFAADPDGFGGNGSQIWTSDGTDAGTTLFKDMLGNGFKVFDNQLFFSGSNVGFPDQELWVSDGTVLGTTLFKDINTNPGEYSDPSGFQVLGDKMYFAVNVDNTTNQRKIFETDGTPGNTFVCEPAIIQNAAYFSSPIGVSKNKLFVTGNYDATIGYETYVITNISGLKWTGTVSTNWFDKRNWNNNEVPAKEDDIKIPASCPRYPIITTGTAYCREMEIQTGGTLTMNGGTLNVYGEITATAANMFALVGGTLKLLHGSDFPPDMGFNNLIIENYDDVVANNFYKFPGGVIILGNFTIKGTSNYNLPRIELFENNAIMVLRNFSISQGQIGLPFGTFANDPALLPTLQFGNAGPGVQSITVNNHPSPDFPGWPTLACNVEILGPVAKINSNLDEVSMFNLVINENFDLAGKTITMLGKIKYFGDLLSPYKITNSKPKSGKITINNDPDFMYDTNDPIIKVDRLRTLNFDIVNFSPNYQTVRLGDPLAVDTLRATGDVFLDLMGQDLTIGKTNTNFGHLQVDWLGASIANGTVSLLGNSSTPRYKLIASEINNFILNSPAGVELNNRSDLDVSNPNYDNIQLYGTAKLTKGNFDMKQTKIFLTSDQFNNNNAAKIIETPGNTFTNSTNDNPPGSNFFLFKDTTIITSSNNIDVGGLGFIITCSNPINDIRILRTPLTNTGLNGGSSINRFYTIFNQGAGINLNAQIKIKYDDSELQGLNESNLAIYRTSSNEPTGVWHEVFSTVNTTTNIVTANGLSQLDYSTGLNQATFYTLASKFIPLKSADTISNQSESNTSKMQVYPNPFQSTFTTQLVSETDESATLRITDISGKLVHIQTIKLTEGVNLINVDVNANLPAGIYIQCITSLHQNKVVKIVKE